MRDYTEASPKKTIDYDATVKKNTENLLHYGASHLGSSVATLEPKFNLGQGGLLNGEKMMP